MIGQRSQRGDLDQTGDPKRRRRARLGGDSPRRRRCRPAIECLEGRQLLSAFSEFPLAEANSNPGDLTVGPDGNFWFPYGNNAPQALADPGIGRITPSGTVSTFPLPISGSQNGRPGDLTVGPDGNLWFQAAGGIGRITPAGVVTVVPLPAATTSPGDLTVGPGGALWFPENQNVYLIGSSYATDGRIARLDPSQMGATGVVAVAHSGKAIRSVTLGFNEALDPVAAANRGSYSLAVGKLKRHALPFAKKVKIKRASYNSSTNTVKLTLARPQKGPLELTVSVGGTAGEGTFDLRDFMAVVE